MRNYSANISAEEITTLLQNIIPDGFEIRDNVKYYTPENLYVKINGRVEYYISYDIKGMAFVDYQKRNQNGAGIRVFVFDMGNPTLAFGAFSGERTRNAESLNLGREAYISSNNIYVWKGQYYIQIKLSQISQSLIETSLDVAEKLATSLNDTGEGVWGLEVLPKENLVPNSVQYFLIDALALSFLHNSFTATYVIEETEVDIFISLPESQELFNEVVLKFKAHLDRYGEKNEIIEINNSKAFSGKIYGTYDIFFSKDSLIAGVTGVENREIAIKSANRLWEILP